MNPTFCQLNYFLFTKMNPAGIEPTTNRYERPVLPLNYGYRKGVRQGLNLRPKDPQTFALPAELHMTKILHVAGFEPATAGSANRYSTS
jgi:hypothetical protein